MIINTYYNANCQTIVFITKCISSYLYKKRGGRTTASSKLLSPFLCTNHGFLRNVKYSRYNFIKKPVNKIPRLNFAKNSFIIWCAKKKFNKQIYYSQCKCAETLFRYE